MATLLMAMMGILLTWALLLLVLSGLGLLLLACVRQPLEGSRQLMLMPWLGVAVVLALLQVWNCFLPVDGYAWLIVLVASGLGFLLAGRTLPAASMMRALRSHPAFVVLALVGALWFANRAVGPCDMTDSGLYHLSAVRWASEYAIVPGLANLHGRFGFNNSIFLFDALLGVGPWHDRASHIANGLFEVMMLPPLLWCAAQVLSRTSPQRRSALFLLPSAMLVVKFAISQDISSFSTDLPTSLLAMVASWRLFALLVDETDGWGGARGELLVIACLLCAAATIKVTIIAFAAIAIPLAVVWALVRLRRSDRPQSRLGPAVLGAILLAPLLFLGLWVARGYVLSGYPLYPSAVAPLNVDWRVDPAQLAIEREGISRYAKTTHLNRDAAISGWTWVRPWFLQTFILRSFADLLMPALVAAGASAIGVMPGIRRSRAPHGRSAPSPGWLLLLPLVPALVVWFVLAPAPRMGVHLWWALAGVVFAMATPEPLLRAFPRFPRAALAAFLIFAALPAPHLVALIHFRYSRDPATAYYQRSPLVALFNPPGADHGFHAPPAPHVEPRITRTGLTVYVAGADALCWDAPLPDTPYFNPGLELRDPRGFQYGFRVRQEAPPTR